MATRIALLRGINVGKANRIPMADLRKVLDRVGFRNVRTLLNTGNVVFEADDSAEEELEHVISTAIIEHFGFNVPTMVLTPHLVQQVIDENPLIGVADNPSKLLIAFLGRDADRTKLAAIAARSDPPDTFVLADRAAYLWCPDGISRSRAARLLLKPIHGTVTTRNLATTLKLRDMAIA